MLYTSTLLRWLERKRYQYEVTYSLYMLTPTEKFIFNSFLFLVLSMIIIAASLYLPEHVTMMAKRAWFYYAGDETVLNMTGTSGGTAVSASASASVAAAAAAAVVVLEGLSSQGTATTTTTTTTTTITITGAAVTAAAAAAAAVAEKVGLKGDKVLDMLGEL